MESRSPHCHAAARSKIVVLYRNMTTIDSLRSLSDPQLLDETRILATQEREATARLIVALAELDARRLYLAQGYSSLFAYCTRCLHYSEHAALNRIEAARAARVFPLIVDRIADGSLTLTAVRLLRPVVTGENHREVIDSARHKTTKEVEVLVASLQPRPPVPSTIRKLPAPSMNAPVSSKPSDQSTGPGACQTAASTASPEPPSRRPLVKPLSAESYRLQITMSLATHDKLRKAQALMRHRVPNGDPAAIIDRALDALLREVERTKCASVDRPRASRKDGSDSRQVPAAIKREIWQRHGAQCAFEGRGGQRCAETDFLEYHHVVPYARGGKAAADNIELRCRAHNGFEWQQHLEGQTMSLVEQAT